MAGRCPICGSPMKGSRDNPKDRGIESCANCKWHAEIIGVCKPHPHRCCYGNARGQLRNLELLKNNGWCMNYDSEDGKQRARDSLLNTCRWCGKVFEDDTEEM